MRSKTSLWIVITLLSIMIVASLGNAAGPDNYFPLEVGNQWTFELSAAGQKLTINYSTVEKTTVDGVETVVFEMKNGDQVQQREFYSINETGVFTIIRETFGFSFKFAPKQQFLKYPVAIGDTWDQVGSFTDESKNTTFSYQTKCEYVGMESVTVPAGTFNALKLSMEMVSAEGTHIKGFRYFAQDIGLIKEDFQFTLNKQTFPITSVLMEYKTVSK